jgi:uncharacterized protein DUF29
MARLYETDFLKWIDHQAAALRARRWDELDVEHLAEEVEALGRSERRELRNRLDVIARHLLKLSHQRERASWQATIREQRRALALLLEDNPSLRREVPEAIRAVYAAAREDAAEEMGVPVTMFPETNPFTPEDVLG